MKKRVIILPLVIIATLILSLMPADIPIDQSGYLSIDTGVALAAEEEPEGVSPEEGEPAEITRTTQLWGYEYTMLSGDTVEVGDSTTSTFKPHIKYNRWNGECWMTLEIPNVVFPSVSPTDDNVVRGTSAVANILFYTFLSGAEYGNFETQLNLKAKPLRSYVLFNLKSEGLDFHYQPELTQEEIDAGFKRPENVVGSYAVYHSSKQNNEYKTGKAFHIYRPLLIDSEGWKVWADLVINEEMGWLAVYIPIDFFENAVYPIYHAAGLTFGYGSASESIIPIYDQISYSTYTGTSGTATSITAYLYNGGQAVGTYAWALYDASDNKVAQTNDGNAPASYEAAWKTLTFTSNPSITAQDYSLCGWGTNVSDLELVYDTVAFFPSGYTSYDWSGNSGVYPATISTPGTNGYKIGIYCTYTLPEATDFVCKIRSSSGDYTGIKAWDTAIACDITTAATKVFTVSDRGTYIVGDDGKTVTFTGGGTGTLKHISTFDKALIVGCSGTINAGTVTINGGHTFTISNTGNQIGDAVASYYNDWADGLDENYVDLSTDWSTNTSHHIKLWADPDLSGTQGSNRHDGTAGSGFLYKNTSTTYSIVARVANIIIDGIEVQAPNSQWGLLYNTDNNFASLVKNCIIHNVGGVATNSGTSIIENCIIYDFGSSGYSVVRFSKVRNCSIYAAAGVGAYSGQIIVRDAECYNVLCFNEDSGTGYNDYYGSTGNYNVSSDTSAPGANSLQEQTSEDIDWVSIVADSEDLHIQSDSCAKDVGDDLSSYFTTDIDGDTRSENWDIGADEFEAGSGTLDIVVNFPTKDFGTVKPNTNHSTGLTYCSLQNVSGGTVDGYIHGTDWTGGVTWTLSDTATPGTNTIGWIAGIEGDSYNKIIKKNEPYTQLFSNLANDATIRFGFQLLSPTITTDDVEKTGVYTVYIIWSE